MGKEASEEERGGCQPQIDDGTSSLAQTTPGNSYNIANPTNSATNTAQASAPTAPSKLNDSQETRHNAEGKGAAETRLEVQNEGLLVQAVKAEPPTTPPVARQVQDINEHLLSVDEVCSKYGTVISHNNIEESAGIPTNVAEERLAKDGPNALTPPIRTSAIMKFVKEVMQPLSALLLLAGLLSFFLYGIDPEKDNLNLSLGIILVVVTMLNALLEFWQKQKSESMLEGFKNLVPQQTVLIRDGVIKPEHSVNLVAGDLIKIKAGDSIPADLRIISANDFKVDNSSLTGESDPLLRTPEVSHESPLEAENLGFFGTLAVAGEAYGIVIRTGDRTVIGSIAGLATSSRKPDSPLTQEINAFVMLIAVIATVLALVFFSAGMVINPSFIENFRFLIGIFVSNVPQGLPATVTILLTFSARRLSTLNVLVKDLQAVDTLGSITLLASDKTGTITQNRMTVVNIWMNLKHYRTIDEDYDFPTTLLSPKVNGYERLIKLLCLNRRAFFDTSRENLEKPLKDRLIVGDATESGILRFVASRSDVGAFERENPRVFDIPFSSESKWALTINRAPHELGSLALYVKGAPERVMKMCNRYVCDSVPMPIDKDFEREFTLAYEKLASHGQRVLGLAYLELPSTFSESSRFSNDDESSFPRGGYIFAGLIGLMDPPKERVAKAIGSCQAAGITVMMVTGDHPLTAEAIARQIGLIIGDTKVQAAKRLGRDVSTLTEDDYRAVVVHGDMLDTLTNLEWDRILAKREIVFARTSPRQKLEIVARCQAKGHVVGVTGDGVNDSPALKRADLGISMGISGSDVSKEAAAMILLDDNFTSIVEGIAQGRLIFANLKKSIKYTLAHILPEVLPFLLYIVIAIPLPMNAFLILMIDLGTEMFSAISLAWEVEEDDLMSSAPRRTVAPKPQLLVGESEVRALSRVASFHIEEIDKVTRSKKSRRSWLSRVPMVDKIPRFKKAHPDDETLVDRHLLFWSYLQTGLIEGIGAMINYYYVWHMGVEENGRFYRAGPRDLLGHRDFPTDPTDTFAVQLGNEENYQRLLRESNAAYFLTIVVSQMFCLYSVKVANGYPFRLDMFRNYWTYLASASSLLFAIGLIHIPGLNTILGAAPIRWEVYLIAIGTGCTIVLYEIVRKTLIRLGLFRNGKRQNAHVIEGIRKTLTRDALGGKPSHP